MNSRRLKNIHRKIQGRSSFIAEKIRREFMIYKISIYVGSNPVKIVDAEINIDLEEPDWPDSFNGKFSQFKKIESLDLLTADRKDVIVGYKGKRYKIDYLDSDGNFGLTKDW
jgi:hypothetical protein